MKFKKLNNGEWEARIKCLGGSFVVTGSIEAAVQERMLLLLCGEANA